MKDKLAKLDRRQVAAYTVIAAALLVSAPRLAAALSFVEPSFLGFPVEILTGPAFGVSTAGAAIYVWDVYNERKRLSLAPWLLVGWVVLLTMIAIILTPGMVVELRKSELAELLKPGWDVAWCALVAIVSELVVALIALALSIATPKAKPKKQKPVPSKPQATEVAKVSVYQCDRCGATENKSGQPFGTKQAVSAHKRFCKLQEQIEREVYNAKVD